MILIILSVLIALVSLLAMVRSYRWWIRIWDFPRPAIALLATANLAAIWLLAEADWRWPLAGLMIAVIIYQLWRIMPYTPLYPSEVMRKPAGHGQHEPLITLLSLNVLQDNRDYQRSLDLIRRIDPDILLLMETDQKWAEALEPVLQDYPHQALEPLDNLYGLIFASRLDVTDARIEYLVDDDTPSVFAQMQSRAGDRFLFIGLHPRPPRPGQDTGPRDAEIAIAALKGNESNLPVITLGDFNDVAWSHTSRLFKRLGEYLDPRIGRGLFPTFPAAFPFIRWPLDHLFVTPQFQLVEIGVLENVGSDHLPVMARLWLTPQSSAHGNETPETADQDDREEAEETIAEHG